MVAESHNVVLARCI